MDPNAQLAMQVYSIFESLPTTPPNLLDNKMEAVDKITKTIGQLLVVIDHARSIIDTAGGIVITTPGYLYMAKVGHALLKMKLFYRHQIKTSHGRSQLLKTINQVLIIHQWHHNEFPITEEYRHTSPYCLSELVMVQNYLLAIQNALMQLQETPTAFNLH